MASQPAGGSPPKPWEKEGNTSGPNPFRPPSNTSTAGSVEASGTANPGEVVPPPVNRPNTAANMNSLSRPVPARPWEQQNYGSTMGGGYGSNLGMTSGYGSGTYGSALGGYGSSYGGGMYGGSSMYRGGYGGGGLYGSSGMYGGGAMGGYGGTSNHKNLQINTFIQEKMASICEDPGKSSWPELLGAKGEDAKEVIERENPKMKAVIILDGTVVPEIFICSRVYVWVNDCGIVVQIPIIG